MSRNAIALSVLISVGTAFYAVGSFALIAVRSIELSPPDVRPVTAIELAAPSLTPVTAHELTAIAAIELLPASLSQSDEEPDKSYNTAKAEIPSATQTKKALPESASNPPTPGDSEADMAQPQSPQAAEDKKPAANSDYNPSVY